MQLAVITFLWVVVARDAMKLRERSGRTPAGISLFAWGALCGLTWIALIPYFRSRPHVTDAAQPISERNLLRWWIVLAVVAAAWSASNVASNHANPAAQHALLSAIFVACALTAARRDRAALAASDRACGRSGRRPDLVVVQARVHLFPAARQNARAGLVAS
ncbi:MAG: hypothetical protein NVSMB55_00750 [Mycobacteriales bacterium]